MQFVSGGPDLPLALLEAARADNVVFVCGAGISQVARKPWFSSFPKLLKAVKKELNFLHNLNTKDTETAFSILLNHYEGEEHIEPVEPVIRGLLQLEQLPSECTNHDLLLKLASSPKRKEPRLVTTNFDNLFELSWKRWKQTESLPRIERASALPDADKQLEGLVYLHGQASCPQSKLVYDTTSFGQAYLGRQWATRFMQDLIRNYTVVFVGYSMNDPLMKYTLHSFEERASHAKPYILCTKKEEERLRHYPLTCLPYEKHEDLWNSLAKWEELKAGEEEAWLTYAKNDLIHSIPVDYTKKEKDFIQLNNLLEWFQVNPSLTKMLLASLPIEWLAFFETVSKEKGKEQTPICFSPLTPGKAYGTLVSLDARPLHEVTQAFGEWLWRHLDKPEVLQFVGRNGCKLHPNLRYYFEHQFGDVKNQLHPALAQAWELLLFHTSDPPEQNFYLYDFKPDLAQRMQDPQKTAFLKQTLLSCLTPRLAISSRDYFDLEFKPETRLWQLVSIDILLSVDENGSYMLQELRKELYENHPGFLASLLEELNGLLLQVIRFSNLFEEPSSLSLEMDSNLRSGLNNNKWTNLVLWLWSAFQAQLELNLVGCQTLVERWADQEHLVFKRLAFKGYAALQDCEDLDQWLEQELDPCT
jgi:SIR2-like domain